CAGSTKAVDYTPIGGVPALHHVVVELEARRVPRHKRFGAFAYRAASVNVRSRSRVVVHENVVVHVVGDWLPPYSKRVDVEYVDREKRVALQGHKSWQASPIVDKTVRGWRRGLHCQLVLDRQPSRHGSGNCIV